MIKFQLDTILKANDISQNKFAKETGIRPNTINNIVNNKTKRIEVKTIDKIVKQINKWGYTVSDLITYEEE